jgi:putative ABC transport system permease protein
MLSAIARKSLGDLRKRKSRTVFTILTIALGVAALGMFGVVPLFDDAMDDDISSTNMWNVRANMPSTHVSSEDLESIESMQNVENVEFKHLFLTKIYIGERRNNALFVGMEDLENAKVDKINLESGSYPGAMEVLTDSGNSRYDLFEGGIGDDVTVMDANGQDLKLTITGKGRTLTYDHATWGTAVFFTDVETVTALSNNTGYNSVSLDLKETSEEKLEKTTEEVRIYLEENTDFVAFTDIPDTREDGSWPGDQEFKDMANFFYVLTFMTLFCSIFLISNTMHTIISEQRKEIAQMKAVGATRKMIVRSYLTTSFIMGAVGSLIGVVLGVAVTFGMVWFLATSFYGLNPEFALHIPTLIISGITGILITIAATMPALIGAIGMNTREGLQETGIKASYGSSPLDRFLLHSKWLPRSGQMGFRNVARKKGRSISTMLQVSLAVAMFLGVVSIGYSLTTTVEKEYDYYPFDIQVHGQTDGGRPLTTSMKSDFESIEGVEDAEPFIESIGEIDGEGIYLEGFHPEPVAFDVEGTMGKGRWFTDEEQENRENVIVLGKGMSKVSGKDLGDVIILQTATGPHQFKIIGINNGQMMNGRIGYMPMTTLQSILKWNDTVSGFIVMTESDSHSLIDKTSTEIEDRMMAMGYVVDNEIWYVMKENNIRSNQKIVNLMIAVGSLIVFITTIGLMSTLTMNVLERTREIGMMRCIGSRAGHLRRVFGSEGLTMAIAGGIIGIPLGYATGRFLNWIMAEILTLEMDLLFPLRFVVMALGMTVVLTAVIIQPPLLRAARFRPGEALRYQ